MSELSSEQIIYGARLRMTLRLEDVEITEPSSAEIADADAD